MRSKRELWYWRLVSSFIVSLILLCSVSGCAATLDSLLNQGIDSPHLSLGNPSGASTRPASTANYLIVRPQYALSYNPEQSIPNWASWQLNQSWLGDLPRLPFQPDASLPTGWNKVTPNDYTGSGFDRGHLVPAADRNKTAADSTAVFWMSNIFPQAPDNNRGPWEGLESYCRVLAKQGKELYIIAGVAGTGGVGEKGRKTAIDRGKIAVPAKTWKVVVVLDAPDLGVEGVTTSTRVIAVVMPNRQGIKEESWRKFRTSVDDVENLTGYDLLSNVSGTVQTVIEARVDER